MCERESEEKMKKRERGGQKLENCEIKQFVKWLDKSNHCTILGLLLAHTRANDKPKKLATLSHSWFLSIKHILVPRRYVSKIEKGSV